MGEDADHEPGPVVRTRAQEQARAAFARTAEPELRRCAFCATESRTRREHCPECGRSYFARPPRLSAGQRRGAWGAGCAVLLAGLILAVPAVVRFSRDSHARRRAGAAAEVAAERARLSREQRPHHGSAVDLRPRPGARAAVRRAARRALVARIEASITGDARARLARRELTGGRVRRTACGALARNQATGDEDLLARPVGRYSCVAVTGDVVSGGESVGSLGIPFVAAADFRRFTYVWCKDNPAANVSERSSQLAFVRLSRECLAARGRVFGTGYVEP